MQGIEQKQARRALAALLLGGILIGGSPIFVRLSELGPVSTAFWRLSLAILPLLLLSAREEISEAKKPRGVSDWFYVCLPGIILGFELTTWHFSVHLTSVANATLFANVSPIFVTLYFWLVLRKAPRKLFLAALAVTCAGVFILKGGSNAIGGGDLLGDAVAVFAALQYAGYLIVMGKVRERFATSTIMIWSSIAGSLILLPFALWHDPALFPFTLAGWGAVIGLSWLCQAGGQSLIAYSLAWLPTTFSSLTLLLQPVVAAVLGWLVLNEALTIWQAIGGCVVLAGIWMARLASRPQ